MGRLLKQDEVCVILGINRETARMWRKAGKGPASFLVGGTVRYDEDDLKAWLKRRREATLSGEAAATG